MSSNCGAPESPPERLLKVPWTARRSNQSILREINPGYSLKADAEAEAPVFWSRDANSRLTGKVPVSGKY